MADKGAAAIGGIAPSHFSAEVIRHQKRYAAVPTAILTGRTDYGRCRTADFVYGLSVLRRLTADTGETSGLRAGWLVAFSEVSSA